MNWIVKCGVLGVLVGIGGAVINTFVSSQWLFIVLIAVFAGAVAYVLERFVPEGKSDG